MRSTVQLNSDELEGKSVLKSHKFTDKKKMLEIYVENLRRKSKLKDGDKRLLELVGLKDIIHLMKERDEYHLDLKIGAH